MMGSGVPDKTMITAFFPFVKLFSRHVKTRLERATVERAPGAVSARCVFISKKAFLMP